MNIARRHRPALMSMAIACAAAVGCQRVPLLAPSGSTITLTSSTTALSVNGTAQIIAQIIEPAGTPPHSGTHIIFTTSLGAIEPSEMETDINGRAVATFRAGNANGTATITAASGGASVPVASALKIAVGTAAVGRVVVSANPTLIPALGGNSTITAAVSDINGNALASAPVAFSTTAGSVSPSIATTDGNGMVTSTLATSTSATVTASVGAQGGSSTGTTPTPPTNPNNPTTPTTPTTPTSSGLASGSVTVNVAAAPGLTITPPATAPQVGLPSNYTFVVTPATTNGSAIRSLVVQWGDSTSQDLGSVSGTSTVSHVYMAARTYTITATLTDAVGTVVTASTAVTVVPVQRPSILITQSPNPGHAGAVTNLTIQVTVPTGIQVQDLQVSFGDGQSADLGGANSAVIPHTYASPGSYTVTVTVLDSANQTSIGTAVISIST